MEKSRGTETWIAECERLFKRCAAAAKKRPDSEAREAFDILFGLLRRIDEAHDEIVFFADEGGSYEVFVDWKNVLPAYFVPVAEKMSGPIGAPAPCREPPFEAKRSQ
jgi:hypothetical protein